MASAFQPRDNQSRRCASTTSLTAIEELILKYVPRHRFDEDDATKEYLLEMLSNDDVYDDLDTLAESLVPFLAETTEEGDNDSDTEEKAHKLSKELHRLFQKRGQRVEPSSARETGVSQQLRALRLGDKGPSPALVDNDCVDQGDIGRADGDKLSRKKQEMSSKKEERRLQRHRGRAKNKQAGKVANPNLDGDDEAFVEDDASAWKDCVSKGQKWGGRGCGGRGEYSGAVNSIKSNIHLTNVTISVPGGGAELLQNATMNITRGHRYGLIGRNGCGKSTLLSRIAGRHIPGIPIGDDELKICLVRQQMEGRTDQSALQVLIASDTIRTTLLEEQEDLERILETQPDGGVDEEYKEDMIRNSVERLGEIAEELDLISADTAGERAVEILKGLQFREGLIYCPTSKLSGGWRMRLALACALFCPSDLLLLDECTNHLDLHGCAWLVNYLTKSKKCDERAVIVVSHDRAFLDLICTDIMVLEHQQLHYHVGSFSDYQRQVQESAARKSQILDASERQRAKAQTFVQKQQSISNRRSADPNKQRQAKMIREKKLNRIGNYRDDGKRYKLNSLKKLSEDYVRVAQKVEIDVDEPVIKMRIPAPTWPSGISSGDAIVRFEDFDFAYEAPGGAVREPLLESVTLSLGRGSKVAVVGPNGAGKSTLVKLIAGEIASKEHSANGTAWTHPSIRIGHVSQYSVEELNQYGHLTVLEFAEQHLLSGRASSGIVSNASGNVRQYLGAFGLGSTTYAHQLISKLSGGERMRLCFASALQDQPQLLLLDESTNHVDIETLDVLSNALNDYDGSVLMVSHNQAFLSGFCTELWVIDGGEVTVTHSDAESFDELFSEYRSNIMAVGGESLAKNRRTQATLAKRADRQRQGAKQNTGFI